MKRFKVYSLLISLVLVTLILYGCSLFKTSMDTNTNLESSASNNAAVNIIGNTNGNIINGGYAAQQGDWIYYSTKGIYKIKMDGTEKNKIGDDQAKYINVVGDWIYYTSQGIYKMKLDGTEKTMLYNDTVPDFMSVSGDWIYFTNGIYSGNLYKVKTDGSEKTKISSDPIGYMNIQGDWIYYSNGTRKEDFKMGNIYVPGFGNLYKMKLDGSEKTKISDDILGYINVSGDWIYYVDSVTTENSSGIANLYRIKTDGTEKNKLNDDETPFINVVGDWIYYSNGGDSGKLYKMKTDGSGNTKINNDSSGSINVVGDWIYYTYYSLFGQKEYKIKTDGTGRTEVN
ncbi:Hypothetical protein Tpal_650 [Trichococcus palustris]|uniref:Prolow-density lipoprotein receptor-related protein 1-like beta-propeller domain-containing protein n=1 Tax=Trichococcus palustris TaxID=140314 RepID=A0A143YCG1_9LACT|nr:DUF5050 domain-containing protein [Trichococcus palustris]CZQ85562.1 Hypothetical protein Tpal_650 [Trichococcus palustris]SFK56266.1 protein of unknown function [Trichococcus palustris]